MLRQREASKVHNKREKQTEQGFTFNEGGGGVGGKKTDELKHHKKTQISTVTEGCL